VRYNELFGIKSKFQKEKMIKSFTDFWINIEKRRTKRNLKKALKKADISTDQDIDSLSDIWKKLQAAKIYNYDEFYNVCLFSAIVGRDIRILWNNYHLTNNENEKNLFGRILSMTIIEFLDEINGMLGKSLRQELQKNGMEKYENELNRINKKFAQIKKQHNTELRKIRNNAAAHKTKKAKDLIDFKKKHFENLFEISTDVSRNNIELTNLTTQIIYEIIDHIKNRKKFNTGA
jgi:hypothetical protein|tara:strand:- start:165 stop:863 length:699 start_codon:yes stop_codon:yes gene_type:complete